MSVLSARSVPSEFSAAGSPVNVLAIARIVLVALPIVLAFSLSPSALIALGDIDYIVPGAPVYAKIHPATYAAAFSLLIFASTGYARKIHRILVVERPALVWYFLALMTIFVYAAAFLAVPFVLLIDNYLLPGMVLILLILLPAQERAVVRRLIDVLFIVNSCLGLWEIASNSRLIPITMWSSTLGQWVFPQEWRASALLGHPLTNSYLTVCYILDVLVTGRIATTSIRFAIIGLHVVALFAFGSRAATVFILIGTIAYLGTDLLGVLRTGRMRLEAIVFFVCCTAAVIAIPVVLASGIADRFLDRFTHDNGSAVARSYMFDLVGNMRFGDLLFGQDAQLTFEVMKRYNIIAIESYWLSFLLVFGVFGCVVFFPALLQMVRCIAHHSSRASYAVMALFFACNSTSTGLGTKTVSFTLVIAICMTHQLRPKLRRPKGAAVRLPPPLVRAMVP